MVRPRGALYFRSFGKYHTRFFIRNYVTSRLMFGQNSMAISKNIPVRIYLTVPNESLHYGIQFETISEGYYRGRNWRITRWELKSIEARTKKSPFL